MRKMSASTRWAVPAGIVAAVGLTIGATAVADAAQPSLPAQSVAQLLADVQQASAQPQGPVTATIQETANLGLPALPQIGAITSQTGQLGALSPLTGTTTVSVWYLNQSHVRIAQEVRMGETDLRLDGTQLWLWDSKTQTATHVLLPRAAGNEARSTKRMTKSVIAHGWASPTSSLTPLAAAKQVLAQIGQSTNVRLGPNVTIAGRAAYQISVSPKAAGSLVSQILIAIDAARHIPLRVEVIARDSSGPAFELGYTALAFGPPAMSNFAFTPPPGAHVKTVTVPSSPAGLKDNLDVPGLGLGALGLGSLGSNGFTGLGWSGAVSPPGTTFSCASNSTTCVLAPESVNAGGPDIRPVLPKSVLKRLEASFAAHLPKSMSKAQRAAAIKQFAKALTSGPAAGVASRQATRSITTGVIRTSATPIPAGGTGSPKVLGKNWTQVLVTPANPEVAAAVRQLLTSGRQGQAQGGGFFIGSSSQAAPAPGSSSSPIPVGPDLAVLRALLEASTPVHGSWGSGRLLQSALLSVLVTAKGQILAGAVTPSVLYADASGQSK